jgi:hypothetical protein
VILEMKLNRGLLDQSMVKLDYKRERDEISTNCMGEIEARINGNS